MTNIAMPMTMTGKPTMMRFTIACDIVCSLDFSEDPNLDGKDDCDDHCGDDDLCVCHVSP